MNNQGGNKMKVELDLSNYVTKVDLKGATGVDTFNIATKLDLVTLKTDVDQIAIDKLKTVPANLSKLSNVVENVVTKCVYDELITKVHAFHSSKLIKTSNYGTRF